MQRIVITLGLIGFGLFVAGCGSTEPPPPKYAPDRTTGGERNTEVTTCRWVPALPENREDPCNQTTNKGATLNITEREDMREESLSEQSHTCVCD